MIHAVSDWIQGDLQRGIGVDLVVFRSVIILFVCSVQSRCVAVPHDSRSSGIDEVRWNIADLESRGANCSLGGYTLLSLFDDGESCLDKT